MEMNFNNLPAMVGQLFETLSAMQIELSSVYRLLEERKEFQKSDKLIGVKEAAEFLGLSTATIYSKTSRGELPTMKRGKKLYFSTDALTEYVKQGTRKSNQQIEQEANDYLNQNKGKNEK